jgi:hypothetical protein
MRRGRIGPGILERTETSALLGDSIENVEEIIISARKLRDDAGRAPGLAHRAGLSTSSAGPRRLAKYSV